jgi:hypothetical protein
MSDLLETALEAHGGLPRCTELKTVSAHLVQGGALWALKGQPGVLDDVFVTASLHVIPAKHRIFSRAPDGQAIAEPLIVSIDVSEVAFA